MPEDLLVEDPNRLQWDVELVKATKDEATGNYIVEGIANTGKRDVEGDELVPNGIDYSYFLKKGHIKWEHHARNGVVQPDQFIGEPLEARVGPEGFYIKGLLYGHHKMTSKIIEQMETLEKSNSSRKMGFSIEGQALKRNPDNPGQVTKSIIRNVAMTMNPVDSGSWAKIAKSLDFSTSDAIEFDLEKTLDTGGAAPLMPQSLEGTHSMYDYNEFAQRVKLVVGRWLGGMHTQMRRRAGFKKSIDIMTPDRIASDLYLVAEQNGFGEETAKEASRYGFTRADMLKSLVAKFAGGEISMDDLAKSLDTSLEDLLKAANNTGADVLVKSQEEEPPFEDEDEGPDEESGEGPDEESGEGPDEEPDHDEDDQEREKSFSTDLVKSHGAGVESALEVSEFLEALVEQVGVSVDGFQNVLTKSLDGQKNFNVLLVKSLVSMGELVKQTRAENEELKEMVKGMADTLGQIANAPVGRKSVVSQREVQTLNKSIGGVQPTTGGQTLTKSMVMDKLVDAASKGDIPIGAVTLFETSGRVMPDVARQIGLDLAPAQ